MSDRHVGGLCVRRSHFQIDVQSIAVLPGCGTGLIQIALLVMTLFRILFYRHTGWIRTPVVSLVLRDGILVFLMLASPSLPKYPPQFRRVNCLCIFIYSYDSPHHRVRDYAHSWGADLSEESSDKSAQVNFCIKLS